jgi:hypothetical protein
MYLKCMFRRCLRARQQPHRAQGTNITFDMRKV